MKNSGDEVLVPKSCRINIIRKRKSNAKVETLEPEIERVCTGVQLQNVLFFDCKHLSRKPIRKVETIEIKDKVFNLSLNVATFMVSGSVN